jgi:hypothetical protein
MNNVTVKEFSNQELLQPENATALKELAIVWLGATKSMGTPTFRDMAGFKKFLNKYPGFFVCAFQNNIMTGYMKCIPSGLHSTIPMYQLNWVQVRKGLYNTADFSNPEHPWIHITDYILSKMEQAGYYSWMNFQAIRPALRKMHKGRRDMMRFCKKGWDDEKQQYRYIRLPLHIVPAGTLSDHETYKLRLGPVPWDHDVVVYQWVLRSEYRPEYQQVKDFWVD